MIRLSDFDLYAVKLNALAAQLSGPALKSSLDAVGVEMQKIAREEAAADLGGDAKFSGWNATLDTRLKHEPGLVRLQPDRVSAGPWTVATSGRNAGGRESLRTSRAGQLQRRAGTRLRKKDGVRVDRWRGTKWNGTTAGKGTADRAQKRMETIVPKKLESTLIVAAVKNAGLS